MLAIVTGIIPILIIISVIVTFHELGHFSVARLFKTRVERFSVGFGKILLRRTDKNGVEWCLSALPLGGYVKFAGDENIASMMPGVEELEAARESITEREGADAVNDYFHFKPLWQRFLIILAGPVANFILAIIVFTLFFMGIGAQIGHPTLKSVVPGGAAQVAGLHANDIIRRVDGHDVVNAADIHQLIASKANTPIQIEVERHKTILTLTATPRQGELPAEKPDQTFKGGVLGVAVTDFHRLNPVQALVKANQTTWYILDTNLTYIGRIFIGKANGDQIGGILGMTKVAGDMALDVTQVKATISEKISALVLTYVPLMAVISIGVGFLNLLPIPLLDGGHLMFYLYQGVAKKPVPAGIQNAAFRIAVVLILGLMLFAAWNDANHIGLIQFIRGFFS